MVGFTLCLVTSFFTRTESYKSVQSGLIGTHCEVDVDVHDNSQPTYCDTILYPNPDDATTTGACASNKLQTPTGESMLVRRHYCHNYDQIVA